MAALPNLRQQWAVMSREEKDAYGSWTAFKKKMQPPEGNRGNTTRMAGGGTIPGTPQFTSSPYNAAAGLGPSATAYSTTASSNPPIPGTPTFDDAEQPTPGTLLELLQFHNLTLV